jgi:hypothetical protein
MKPPDSPEGQWFKFGPACEGEGVESQEVTHSTGEYAN